MSHTNPYRPSAAADADEQIANQVFAPRGGTSALEMELQNDVAEAQDDISSLFALIAELQYEISSMSGVSPRRIAVFTTLRV